jgi:hypothetical protein
VENLRDFSNLVIGNKEEEKEQIYYQEPVIEEDHFKRGSLRGNQKASSSFGPTSSDPNTSNELKKSVFNFIPLKKNASSFILSQ